MWQAPHPKHREVASVPAAAAALLGDEDAKDNNNDYDDDSNNDDVELPHDDNKVDAT